MKYRAMHWSADAFLKDRRGVVPIEYLHVVTLVTAAIVTAIHYIFT